MFLKSLFVWCAVPLVGGYIFNSAKYSLNPTRKDIAVDFLNSINGNPIDDDQGLGLSTARLWCKEHKYDDHYLVSFVCDNAVGNKDYMVLYRQNKEVLTVSGLVRLQQTTTLSTSDLFVLLRRDSEPRGYLQLHELKTWCNGRYAVESFLEDMFCQELIK